jgi:RNA polymerase-binding transcription factor DksA
MDEFEKKIKKKLEEMRADILSKTKIPSKIHDVESISIHTDILKLIERALDKIQNGNYGYCEICGKKIVI